MKATQNNIQMYVERVYVCAGNIRADRTWPLYAQNIDRVGNYVSLRWSICSSMKTIDTKTN